MDIKECMTHYRVQGLSLSLINNLQIINTEHYGVLEAGTERIVDNNSVFNACSISKFLTSILVMKLTAQGIIDLDENVNNKLKSWEIPDNQYTAVNKVSLRNLLSHQSGIIDPDGSFNEYQTDKGFPSMTGLLKGTSLYNTIPIEVTYEPGTKFHYSDAGFCIIQQLIEDVMKKPFQEVLSEEIFVPLHMKNSTFDINGFKVSCGHNKYGEIVDGKHPIYPYPAACGFWTTASDLAKLLLELFEAIREKSRLGISSSVAKEMIQSQNGMEWTGLGVFLDDSGDEFEISSLGWGIGFQCMLVGFPQSGSGMVVLTNTDLGVHQLKGIIGDIYRDYMNC